MLVVSGCPRSGTSLMMRLLGLALGEDRIFGDEFPQERHLVEFEKRGECESEAQHAYRMYAARVLEPDADKNMAHARDMNPNGFWECPFTIRGVRFRADIEDRLRDLEAEKERPTICKIVSQGLAQSDPRYIHKVILMVRHPRAVAKSQERLRREMKFRTEDGVERDLYEGAVVHSPQMFIGVTLAAMRWIRRHPDVPVHLVRYDDLIADAPTTLGGVMAFLGEGDAEAWARASSVINPDLKRSYPEEKPSNLWQDAEDVYRILVERDFEAMERFMGERWRMTFREEVSWPCVRCEQPMVEAHCLRCRVNHGGFRDKLREFADKNGIPWRERPCAFEVAHDRDRPLVSIEESIERNTWAVGLAATGS